MLNESLHKIPGNWKEVWILMLVHKVYILTKHGGIMPWGMTKRLISLKSIRLIQVM
mgnify:CR=1 FL=1